MPSRARNRLQWVREKAPPFRVLTDANGYPLAVGDTVRGCGSGRPYEITVQRVPPKIARVADPHMSRRYRTVRKEGYPVERTIGVARDGKLDVTLRPEREKFRIRFAKAPRSFYPIEAHPLA